MVFCYRYIIFLVYLVLYNKKGLVNVNAHQLFPDYQKPYYLANRYFVDFYQALTICKQYGMILASIRSEDEELALEQYMKTLKPGVGPGNGFWIAGVRQSPSSTNFAWLTTGVPVIYHKYSTTLGTENCLEWVEELPNKFVWKDYRCTKSLGFICQTFVNN